MRSIIVLVRRPPPSCIGPVSALVGPADGLILLLVLLPTIHALPSLYGKKRESKSFEWVHEVVAYSAS